MYVAELDRPWTDTPFMFQGFHLRTDQQLETLKKFCKHVFVDMEKTEVEDRSRPRAAGLHLHDRVRALPGAGARGARAARIARPPAGRRQDPAPGLDHGKAGTPDAGAGRVREKARRPVRGDPEGDARPAVAAA